MSRENWIREDGLEEDRLFKTHKNLRLKWQWHSIKHTKNSSQCSHAKLYDWKLRAIHWHSYYEAEVNYFDNEIVSKDGFKTRLDAQIGAEKLLFKWLEKEYKKIIPRLQMKGKNDKRR